MQLQVGTNNCAYVGTISYKQVQIFVPMQVQLVTSRYKYLCLCRYSQLQVDTNNCAYVCTYKQLQVGTNNFAYVGTYKQVQIIVPIKVQINEWQWVVFVSQSVEWMLPTFRDPRLKSQPNVILISRQICPLNVINLKS